GGARPCSGACADSSGSERLADRRAGPFEFRNAAPARSGTRGCAVNKFTLQLRVKQSEGALVRILGVTRRRRFDLLHLTADTSEDRHLLDVQMTRQADRAENTLVRQIEKLEDVSQVAVVEPDEAPAQRRAA